MKRLLALVLSMMLAACASVPSSGSSTTRPLLPPASLDGERSVSQVVRGAVGAREMTLSCVVTVKDGAMTVVGLNAMGVRLFTVRYDGQKVHADQMPGVPEQLTAERLIADLQLVFWPLPALQSTLAGAGWQLTEPVQGTRRLRRGEQLVAEAHYAGPDPWAGRSWLVNVEYGYSLQIDSKEL